MANNMLAAFGYAAQLFAKAVTQVADGNVDVLPKSGAEI